MNTVQCYLNAEFRKLIEMEQNRGFQGRGEDVKVGIRGYKVLAVQDE